jgi:hypothetical protein
MGGVETWLSSQTADFFDIGTQKNPCGGGIEYLHRDPVSRKRRRNGTKNKPRHSLSD